MKPLKTIWLTTALAAILTYAPNANAVPSSANGQQAYEKGWAFTDTANTKSHLRELGGDKNIEDQKAETSEDLGKRLAATGTPEISEIIKSSDIKVTMDKGDMELAVADNPWKGAAAKERLTAEAELINHQIANKELVGKLSDPQRWVKPAQAAAQAQATNAGNAAAEVSRDQASSAIDFCAHYLYNFTVDGSNKWNLLRNSIFVPMGILLLLPGALLTQIRAIMAAGNPVLGNVNPLEGIMRSVIAIFLIPSTYLVVNYSIDLANSITFTINSEYFRLFKSDMYKDAICAEIRAFPVRGEHENRNALDLPVPAMTPLVNPGGLFAQFEGMMENKIEDPCSNLYQAPKGRADEAMSSASVAARLGLNGSNAALTASWNILCAFQMAYLYYLWFVGPIAAGLWVWPMKQLRGALPSWVEGVITLAFWSLFWNTAILLIACFKGVGETGSVLMTALHFLATASVKHAFDFAGLVRAAGQEAANMAEKAMKSGGAGGGSGGGGGSCGGGASKGGGAQGGAPATADGIGALTSNTSGAAGATAGLSHTAASPLASHAGSRSMGLGDHGGPVHREGLSGRLGELAHSGKGDNGAIPSERLAISAPPTLGTGVSGGDGANGGIGLRGDGSGSEVGLPGGPPISLCSADINVDNDSTLAFNAGDDSFEAYANEFGADELAFEGDEQSLEQVSEFAGAAAAYDSAKLAEGLALSTNPPPNEAQDQAKRDALMKEMASAEQDRHAQAVAQHEANQRDQQDSRAALARDLAAHHESHHAGAHHADSHHAGSNHYASFDANHANMTAFHANASSTNLSNISGGDFIAAPPSFSRDSNFDIDSTLTDIDLSSDSLVANVTSSGGFVSNDYSSSADLSRTSMDAAEVLSPVTGVSAIDASIDASTSLSSTSISDNTIAANSYAANSISANFAANTLAANLYADTTYAANTYAASSVNPASVIDSTSSFVNNNGSTYLDRSLASTTASSVTGSEAYSAPLVTNVAPAPSVVGPTTDAPNSVPGATYAAQSVQSGQVVAPMESYNAAATPVFAAQGASVFASILPAASPAEYTTSQSVPGSQAATNMEYVSAAQSLPVAQSYAAGASGAPVEYYAAQPVPQQASVSASNSYAADYVQQTQYAPAAQNVPQQGVPSSFIQPTVPANEYYAAPSQTAPIVASLIASEQNFANSAQTYSSPAQYYLANMPAESRAIPQADVSTQRHFQAPPEVSYSVASNSDVVYSGASNSDVVYSRSASDAYTTVAPYHQVENVEARPVSFAPAPAHNVQHGPHSVAQFEAQLSQEQVHSKVQQAHGLITKMNDILASFEAPHAVTAAVGTAATGNHDSSVYNHSAYSSITAHSNNYTTEHSSQNNQTTNIAKHLVMNATKRSLAELLPVQPLSQSNQKGPAPTSPPPMSDAWFDA